MITLSRVQLFGSRWLRARRHGFAYRGTSKTQFPSSIRLGGRTVSLAAPLGGDCVLDLFNVLLDDEYGLAVVNEAPKVIVDVGVNMGIFALSAWHHFPMARIYGFEPNPLAYEKAVQNLGATDVRVFNEAVGETSGLCSLLDHQQSRLCRTSLCEGGEIPMIGLSEVLARCGGGIDLLKLDCEGAEWDILKDSASVACVGSIRMEYHLLGGRKLEDLISLLEAGGQAIVKCRRQGNHGILWTTRG